MTVITTRYLPFRALIPAAALLIGALAQGGCSDIRQAVGAEKAPPDEFQVRVRAPLSLPRDYGLRAPAPGTERPQAVRERDRARQIVLESDESRKGKLSERRRVKGVSPAEAALLAKLGGEDVDPGIRQVVERETNAINEDSKSFVDSLIFWREDPPPGTAVDPREESRRLQENVALGRPADSGKTPVIERKSKGLFTKGLFKDLF